MQPKPSRNIAEAMQARETSTPASAIPAPQHNAALDAVSSPSELIDSRIATQYRAVELSRCLPSPPVSPSSEAKKHHDIYAILDQHLPSETEGGAIVYCSTRRRTKQVAEFLKEREVNADLFRAGLPPEEKRLFRKPS